jgi:hypothetical protein
MSIAKYYRLYPGHADAIMASLWAEHTGFAADGRPLYTFTNDRGLSTPGVTSTPPGRGLVDPKNTLAINIVPPRGAMPPPPDGWEALSILQPGAPPITPPAPPGPSPNPQAEGLWTAQKERAWIAWCQRVDEILARRLGE